jgi:hypothetical protein
MVHDADEKELLSTDSFTKVSSNKNKWRTFLMNKTFYPPLMIVALIFLTVWALYGQEQSNTVKQTWEYKSVMIVRAAMVNADFSDWFESSGQTVKQLASPVSIPAKTKELGDQGWELVSVTPISNNLCQECGGFTSQINYYFKRPK